MPNIYIIDIGVVLGIVSAPSFSLSGTVKDGAASPLKREIKAFRDNNISNILSQTISDPTTGEFTLEILDLPTGKYTVIATGSAGENSAVFSGITVA